MKTELYNKNGDAKTFLFVNETTEMLECPFCGKDIIDFGDDFAEYQDDKYQSCSCEHCNKEFAILIS